MPVKKAHENTIIYVTRDIERALGMEPRESYQIVTNDTAYSRTIKEKYPDFVHLVSSEKRVVENAGGDKDIEGLLDTWELLEYISKNKQRFSIFNIQSSIPNILVFKNTSKIEEICKKNDWTLLNPPSALAEKIENKMTQVEFLGELGVKYLPEHEITASKNITWNKKPLIIQWAHSHTGDGTTLVNSKEELKAIQDKFPERLARVTNYVNGPSFTINVSVGDTNVIIGNISYQITGIPPFTENPFSTIGNDWSLTHSLLNESEIEYIENMATDIAHKLQSDGWKGLFGIDVMRDDEQDKIFLIEINARQPASTTYESQLQMINRGHGMSGQTIFEAHLESLKSIKSVKSDEKQVAIHINDGAQIIQRVTRVAQSISNAQIKSLHDIGCTTILYENTDENSDLLRIQCPMGIMETHGRFNKRGKAVLEILNG